MERISKKIRDLNHNIKTAISNGNDPKEYLNFTQFQIIKYLIDHENEDVCQKDLEIETHLKKASITGTIDSLEDKGLVRRQQAKNDKRKNIIEITERVENIKKEFENSIEEVEKKMLKGITKEELNAFVKVVDKINKNLGKGK